MSRLLERPMSRRAFLRLLAKLGIAGTIAVLGLKTFVNMWTWAQETLSPPPRPKDYDYGELSVLDLTLLGPLASGIEGEWLFNEGEGNVLHDYSPYKRHGTIYNARWVRDAGKWGLDFSGGTGHYVEIPYFYVNAPIAIECICVLFKDSDTMIRHAAGVPDWLVEWGNGSWGQPGNYIQFGVRGTDGAFKRLALYGPIDYGRCIHVICIYDKEYGYIYVNGTLARRSNDSGYTGDIGSCNAPLRFGNTISYEVFIGRLYRVIVYGPREFEVLKQIGMDYNEFARTMFALAKLVQPAIR